MAVPQPGQRVKVHYHLRRKDFSVTCAYAAGTVTAVSSGPDLAGWARVTFNPFRAGTFTLGGEPVTRASLVVFAGAYAWVPPGAAGLW
jgi:hypothetical protein